MPFFDILAKSEGNKARAGILNLPTGKVQTPVFMPIGTVGSVKSLTTLDLQFLGAEIILSNTYHLWLRPDMEIIEAAGGLHKFMNWEGPIITDSGGFQAFSLAKIRHFDEEGVTFQSHLNGETRFLSPEKSMQIQTSLGTNIALVLDECLPAEVDKETARQAMLRTRRWAKRSRTEYERLREIKQHDNLLFGIPQGAQFIELREESARLTMELGFPGYSIGGVANGGEPEEVMYQQVLAQTEILEDEKPRHLLGVGTPKDLVQMTARGIDMFDCVMPTRNARHGGLFTTVDDNSYATIRIKNEKYKFDFTPINPNSRFPELRTYTKSYLRHLFIAKELLYFRLATLNNLEFYLDLMQTIRIRIMDGSFGQWWEGYHENKI
ncbi:MAG: tRNA guanosine(34) transglycosylase Tgt [Patescibacteria group bacterium]